MINWLLAIATAIIVLLVGLSIIYNMEEQIKSECIRTKQPLENCTLNVSNSIARTGIRWDTNLKGGTNDKDFQKQEDAGD